MTDEISINELESIDIRPANNGFVVTARSEDGETEFVFDSHNKTLRFLKKVLTPE